MALPEKIVFDNVRLSGRTERFGPSSNRKGEIVVRVKNEDAELSIQATRDDAPDLESAATYRIILEKVA